MITREQYEEIKARNDKLTAWVDSIRGKNGWASYKPEDKPSHVPDCTNEERGEMELYEFCTNPPDKYFLYVSEEKRTAFTWPGQTLGTVQFGRAYKVPAFGGWPSVRVPVTIHAVNGLTYHGTYYKSSGDYARIERAKR